jgi:glycosyltransferase involved in cell wall biosynthesis
MAAGVPCIGTQVGGIPESIADGKTGLLVPPADEAALAQAMERLLADPSEAASLAEAGKQFVRANFSVDMATHRIEDFYARLLKGPVPA